MTTHRAHPRRAMPRPGLFVAGGNPTPEDFRPEATPAAELTANLAAGGPSPRELADRIAASPELSAEARRLIDWDREAAVEPYQLDVTRGLEDTVRMGNSLSAAVRLELLADRMREEVQDRHRDPVDGVELDPVDGLPLGDEDDDEACACQTLRPGEECPAHPFDASQYKSNEDTGHQLVPADPAPAPQVIDSPPEYGGVQPVPMGAEEARRTAGVPARIMDWTSRHDPASLEYAVRARLRAPAPLVDRLWPHGPILDQGTTPPLSQHDASGCTGHALVNAANVLELVAQNGGTPHPDDLFTHTDAMKAYELAQTLDDVPGEAYSGTSVLAAMKAGVQLGWFASYLWAFGTKDVAQAILQVGPVVIGIPWLTRMSAPGPDGIVTVAGDDAGGHALCLFAIRMAVAGKAGPWFGALQSWGEGVGDHGVIWIHHRDLARLLHSQGEAAIPIPAGV